MTDSPHFSENDDVEINLDVLTPDETEKKDDQVDIDLGDLGEEDSAKEPEI
ncbi:MAG: Transcription antitermination protein nusG, partial [Propionibacterium sp. DORA_15]